MAAFLLNTVLILGGIWVMAIVLEKILRDGAHLFASILPNDVCGPDGWLVDTTRRCGIFDRHIRG